MADEARVRSASLGARSSRSPGAGGCSRPVAAFTSTFGRGKPVAAVAGALGGLPKVKMHCSVLAEEAMKSALDDYYKKKGVPSPVKVPDSHGHEHEIE